MTRKQQADFFLYDCGLLEELEKYGRPHIIGSYRMDLMAWNDLDIDIENDKMSMEKLYDLSHFVTKTFRPTWYEAKEERAGENRPAWFFGFETLAVGELWNVDLWFFDCEVIRKAETYCDSIVQKIAENPELKQVIIGIKQELIAKGLYSFEKYTSTDVYDTVLNRRARSIGEFLESV